MYMPACQMAQVSGPAYSSTRVLVKHRLQSRHRVGHQGPPCIMSASSQTNSAPVTTAKLMEERKEFLKQDLQHLFDDQGIDTSAYEDKVRFEDPITRYGSAKGYMFNIAMLKKVFNPTFQLHDIRQTAEHELTTRWTMTMELTVNRISPLRKFWDPTLIFTGTSIMTLNPETGKFKSHVDTWDAIKNQKYLSLEAVLHLLSQLGSLMRQPDLESPPYTILKKKADYEVRRYEPFMVAEASMLSGKQPDAADAAGAGSDAAPSSGAAGARSSFGKLAGYIFGKNQEERKMAMTMPVLSDSMGHMQFYMGSQHQDSSSLPAPLEQEVSLLRKPGGIVAARSFSGRADQEAAEQQLQILKQVVERDGLSVASEEWQLARYNDPSTKPMFRRNEVMLEIAEFDLWQT